MLGVGWGVPWVVDHSRSTDDDKIGYGRLTRSRLGTRAAACGWGGRVSSEEMSGSIAIAKFRRRTADSPNQSASPGGDGVEWDGMGWNVCERPIVMWEPGRETPQHQHQHPPTPRAVQKRRNARTNELPGLLHVLVQGLGLARRRRACVDAAPAAPLATRLVTHCVLLAACCCCCCWLRPVKSIDRSLPVPVPVPVACRVAGVREGRSVSTTSEHE